MSHFDIWTVAMCIALSLMCLTFKEPILAIKLANHEVDTINVGLIFSLDTIMYTVGSIGLNFVKEEANGKKYGRIQYYGCLVFVVSMILTGPAPFTDPLINVLHREDLCTLCIGVLMAGIGGALINNNSTPAMILTESKESEIRLGRPLNNKEKEKLQSSVSAINTGGFGVGSIVGPILASFLDSQYGFKNAFMTAGIIVFVLSFFHLAS